MLDIQYTLPLIGSEIALSLYPQLIKLVPTTIETQVVVRCITYSLLAIIGYYISDIKLRGDSGSSNSKIISNNSLSFINSLVMGIVNIIHIVSSYMSFSILSSGVSYSIFYTYPIFNLLGRTLFYNETISLINYLYISISIIGVYLIYSRETETERKDKNIDNIDNKDNVDNIDNKDNKDNVDNKDKNSLINKLITNTNSRNIGVISGIISAITESIIYFMVKSGSIETSPFIQLLKTYLLGGILSIIYLIKYVKDINLDVNYWITLILFNALIGFVGYLVRFMMIPHLSTLLFNSLIFIGVIFSYSWGYILSNETIDYNNVSGTILILWSIFQINKK